MRTTLIAALLPLVSAPVLARAQPIEGLYIGAGGGGDIAQSFKQTSSNPGSELPAASKDRWKTGVVGVGSIGYGFGGGLRLEVEGNFRTNRLKPSSGSLPNNPGTAGGREDRYGPMLNAIYDFDVGSPYFWPYAGLGAGYLWTRAKTEGRYANGTQVSLDGTDGAFAYQGIVGIAFAVPDVPGLSITGEYRYLGMTGGRHFDGSVVSPGQAAESQRVKFRAEGDHAGLLGLRYALGQEPPPLAPPPAPPVADAKTRSYLVFFDWDRADLTVRARQIVADAAHAAGASQTTRIDVAGHADLSGTPPYNQRLSQRRADAVAGELVRDGIGRDEIMIEAFGDTRPLVPTARGVREPQNRRVEIVLH